MTSWYMWQDGDLLLRVRVQPRASRDAIVGPMGDELKIAITAPPVDGRANAHLIAFLARTFGVAKNAVTLLGGENSRSKRLHIKKPAKLPISIRST